MSETLSITEVVQTAETLMTAGKSSSLLSVASIPEKP